MYIFVSEIGSDQSVYQLTVKFHASRTRYYHLTISLQFVQSRLIRVTNIDSFVKFVD